MSSPTIIPPGGSRARIHRPRQPLTSTPPNQPQIFTPDAQPRISKPRAILHYLILVFPDLLFMALAAGLMGALAFVPNYKTGSHLFPMWIDPGTKLWVGPVEYSYPYLPFILTTTQAAVVDILVPVAGVLGVQVWVRGFWDANAALFALFKALIVMTLLQQILKTYIGGLRPYFLTICRPNTHLLDSLLSSLPNSSSLSPLTSSSSSSKFTSPPYNRLIVSPSICLTPPHILHKHLALASFPSGHAGNAFAAATVLSLYLNGKLHAFSNVHTSFWKHLVVLAPLVGATLVAGNELRDHHHHIGDILAGISLGAMAGGWAYRAHFGALFDGSRNGIPLEYGARGKGVGYKSSSRENDISDENGGERGAELGGEEGAERGRATDGTVHRPRLGRAGRGGAGTEDSSPPPAMGVVTGPGPGPASVGADGSMELDRPAGSDGPFDSINPVAMGMGMGMDGTAGFDDPESSTADGMADPHGQQQRPRRVMRFNGRMQSGGPVVGLNGILAEGEVLSPLVDGGLGSLRWV